MKYPARFECDHGAYVVTFRDIPEAITQGETMSEAIEMAQDALETSFEFYFEDERAVPMPSGAAAGERLIPVSEPVAARVRAHNARTRISN